MWLQKYLWTGIWNFAQLLSWNLPLGVSLTKETDLWRHQPVFADVSKNGFWSVYTQVTQNKHKSSDMTDDVINQLLLSRVIPGVSFNFMAYVEPEMPGGRGCIPAPPPKKKKLLA